MRLVVGQDAVVAAWARDKYAGGVEAYLHAFGIVDSDGAIRGAATLHYHGGANLELCYWGPRSVTLNIARQIANICFNGLKVCRVTCRTPRGNKIVVRHLPKLGFRYEGVMRHYYGPTKKQDAIVFGMTRADAERLLRKSA